MATVTGMTAEAIQDLFDQAIVSVALVNGALIFTNGADESVTFPIEAGGTLDGGAF